MLAAFLKCIYAAWLLYWLFFENSIHTLALLLDWEAVELVLNQIRFAGKIKVSLLSAILGAENIFPVYISK